MPVEVRPVPAPVTVNAVGVVEHPEVGPTPYAVDRDGRPFLPVGDGGLVLGLSLGDGVFARDADHAAPGACLVHPEPAARLALVGLACVGNRVEVITGAATGAAGWVVGKRGEAGRVVASLAQVDLARLAPGDRLRVATLGQGIAIAGAPEVSVRNLDPATLAAMPLSLTGGASPRLTVPVRAVLPGRLAGNGVGRPAHQWDLDLQVVPEDAARWGAEDLRLGDLVAVTDLEARHNMGYRRGWTTVGIVVHGASRVPGHGPGVTPILTGPAQALLAQRCEDPALNLSAWLPGPA